MFFKLKINLHLQLRVITFWHKEGYGVVDYVEGRKNIIIGHLRLELIVFNLAAVKIDLFDVKIGISDVSFVCLGQTRPFT